MTKTDLNYPAFSLGFVDFAVQFYRSFSLSRNKKLIENYPVDKVKKL